MIRDYFRNYLWNICDTTLMLGRKPAVKFHNNHDEEDWNVTLVETGLETMTACRIRRIEKYLGEDEKFLLTYGDGLGDVDIPASIIQDQQTGKVCTLTAVHPPGRFGEMGVLSNHTVKGFNEKPQAEGGFINGGYMVCSRKLFVYLPDDPGMMLEQASMKGMAAAGLLGAFQHAGFWQPMDTLQEYSLLNRLWDGGSAPWKIW